MRYLFSTLVYIAWGLWFGGLVALFLFLHAASEALILDRTAFGLTGSAVIHLFQTYQLVLAGVALLGTFGLYLSRRNLATVIVFALFAVAVLGDIYMAVSLTPAIDSMRLHHLITTPAFASTHGLSMIVASAQVLVLLIAGILFGSINSPVQKPQTASTTAAA